MILNRAAYAPGELLEFYEEALTSLGALCERTWHDRLDVVAEGGSAALWNREGTLHEVELCFAPGDAASARDAEREVFPGCPATFKLAEALLGSPPPLERFILPAAAPARPPDAALAEKRWRLQFADVRRWQLLSPFHAGHHFTLLALVRCEIQAIDQHWSPHRLALSLPGGEKDDDLARELGFHLLAGEAAGGIDWPEPDAARWRELIRSALKAELAPELARVRERQENGLRRELERIDRYFEDYERELRARAARARCANESALARISDRLAAAEAEHARRRTDQLARHEIRVCPRLDALVLVAERAWAAHLQIEQAHQSRTVEALFVPRSRRWSIKEG